MQAPCSHLVEHDLVDAVWENYGELKKTLQEIFALKHLSHTHRLPPLVESVADTHGLVVFGTDSDRSAAHVGERVGERVAVGSYVAAQLRIVLGAEKKCVGQFEQCSDHTLADCSAVGPAPERSVGAGFAHFWCIRTGYHCMGDCLLVVIVEASRGHQHCAPDVSDHSVSGSDHAETVADSAEVVGAGHDHLHHVQADNFHHQPLLADVREDCCLEKAVQLHHGMEAVHE